MTRGPGVSGSAGSRFEVLMNERFTAMEGQRRRRNIALLGLLVVASVLLPDIMIVPGNSDVTWVNFKLLAESRAPAVIRYIAIHPLLAGLLCLAMVCPVPERTRGGLLVVMTCIPLAVLFGNSDFRQLMTQGAPRYMKEIGVQLMSGFGGIALLAGARSRWYRPTSAIAYGFGLVGGIMVVLSQLVPTSTPDGRTSIGLIMPFQMMGQSGMAWMAFTIILCQGCILASAVLCALNVPTAHGPAVRRRANLAYWLIFGGMAIAAFGAVTTLMYHARELGSGGMLFTMIWEMAKYIVMIGGVYLMLPFGVVDLIIGAAPEPVRPGGMTPSLYSRTAAAPLAPAGQAQFRPASPMYASPTSGQGGATQRPMPRAPVFDPFAPENPPESPPGPGQPPPPSPGGAG